MTIKIRLITFFAAEDGEVLSRQQKQDLAKEEPAAQEGCDEDGHFVSPFEVQHGRPYVHKEYQPRLRLHVAKFNVAPSIFGDQPRSPPRTPKKASDKPFPKMLEHSFCQHTDLKTHQRKTKRKKIMCIALMS